MTPLKAEKTTYVVQGDFHTSRDPDEILSTILGSCVSLCLFDRTAGVGGMNHFLLPAGPGSGQDRSVRYGVNAMEMLINGLLKMGANRSRFEGKLFGGARISEQFTDIGATNAAFAKTFLRNEDIPCVAESLGGTNARRVLFWPVTGQAKQLLVPSNTLAPEVPQAPPKVAEVKDHITLF